MTKEWGRLLKQYLKGPEEQVDLLLTLEEICNEEAPFGPTSHGSRFVPLFPRVGALLLLQEEPWESAGLCLLLEECVCSLSVMSGSGGLALGDHSLCAAADSAATV